MEVLCRFNGRLQSSMQEMLNTSPMLDGSPIPVQASNAFEHRSFLMDIKCRLKGQTHSRIKEILNTSPMLDGIRMPIQKLNAIENQRNAKYISHCNKKPKILYRFKR